MKRGLFISFEGIDKCGKTTQAMLLRESLKKGGYDVVLTREPGGTRVGEAMWKVLKDPQYFGSVIPMTELFFYAACRAQHTAEVIVPAIKRGKIVISDRFSDSTIAYQGYGRGLDLALLQLINNAVTGGLEPDVTIFIDIPIEEANKRLFGKPDRLEREVVSFHRRVAEGFKAIAQEYPERIIVVDGCQSIEDVALRIREALNGKVDIW